MADYEYITSTGVILPDTATLQDDVEAEFRAALGADLVVDPATPQGALITAETLAREGVVRNNAGLANQINPNEAGGIFLASIWALTGGAPYAATYSTIPGVLLGGIPGTLVPVGSQASTPDGTVFASVTDVTLDTLGVGSVEFQALETGPLVAGVGTLTQIVAGPLGWDTVTNPTAATLGRLEESDVASRQRRKNTLSLQNVALPEAITSALYNVPNVRSLAFRENVTEVTAVIDGITLVAKSVWACVDGGTDADIAAALLANKSFGANWNGATTANVVEPSSGQTYLVKWDRPTPRGVQVRITVRNLSSPVANVTEAVRDALMAYAEGRIDGERGFVVGGDVSPFELAGAVNIQYPGLYVKICEVSFTAVTSWTTSPLDLALNEIATLLRANITVTVE